MFARGFGGPKGSGESNRDVRGTVMKRSFRKEPGSNRESSGKVYRRSLKAAEGRNEMFTGGSTRGVLKGNGESN